MCWNTKWLPAQFLSFVYEHYIVIMLLCVAWVFHMFFHYWTISSLDGILINISCHLGWFRQEQLVYFPSFFLSDISIQVVNQSCNLLGFVMFGKRIIFLIQPFLHHTCLEEADRCDEESTFLKEKYFLKTYCIITKRATQIVKERNYIYHCSYKGYCSILS